MSWTTPADLRAQAQKLWDKGLMLASLVEENGLFPRRLTLKGPSSSELTDQFDAVRAWIADLRRGTHYRVAMREVRHRILGANLIPDEVWIDTLDAALALIGKSRDAKRFGAIVTLMRERQPSALPWLAKYPLLALEMADQWPRLLDVIDWIKTHPRPDVYLRQIDIPGIHTKFIETNRALLAELLDLALPSEAIDRQAIRAGQFCRRYGFRDKPIRVRFRILDPRLALLPGDADQDFTINYDAFARLETKATRVFITENEINFLAFPRVADSLVIFGAGYGFDMLTDAAWLHRCTVYYWGDIDTHGFAILDQLRAHLPHVVSFLMDRQTLLAHESQWIDEPQPLSRDLARLDTNERELFDDLRDNRIRPALRLEQERIGFRWVEAALEKVALHASHQLSE
ncbi:MAG TPA: Wadjet anti-phage system protein JetD domain-containing protein [Burkholderiales bacterium]|nr:Wadjet anti-phage system protein JetD domain-containing protein [Burkholderiales bacterium]